MSAKPYKQISAERRERILARESLIPKGRCHFCDYSVPKGAIWCAILCCTDYEAERDELLNGIKPK